MKRPRHDARYVARVGIEPTTFRFSGGRSYQLSYLAGWCRCTDFRLITRNLATLTGLEPATSAVTGRRANQLRHRALHVQHAARRFRDVTSNAGWRTPYGIRTRATALKGRRPRPLNEGGQYLRGELDELRTPAGIFSNPQARRTRGRRSDPGSPVGQIMRAPRPRPPVWPEASRAAPRPPPGRRRSRR